jgi:hypothetical protein
VDADALWICPQFAEVIRRREAIARQFERNRNNLHPDLQHKSRPSDHEVKLQRRALRSPEEVKVMKRRERKQLRAAKRKRLAQARFEVV